MPPRDRDDFLLLLKKVAGGGCTLSSAMAFSTHEVDTGAGQGCLLALGIKILGFPSGKLGLWTFFSLRIEGLNTVRCMWYAPEPSHPPCVTCVP